MLGVRSIKHWVIKLSIWRNHSLRKTTERRTRKIHRRRNPEIIHHWCLRIHRRWHPRVISWLRWHLIWRRHHHISSSIHEIPDKRIFSRHHWCRGPYICTLSRRHHTWRGHVHEGRILIEKLELFCILITAQFFSIFSILWISTLVTFARCFFLYSCRLRIRLFWWLILRLLLYVENVFDWFVYVRSLLVGWLGHSSRFDWLLHPIIINYN